jgi:signal transduction histidine kinase
MMDSAGTGASVGVVLGDGPEIERLAARIQALVDAAVDEELGALESGYQRAHERETAAMRLTIVVACSVAGLAMLTGLHAARSILAPVRRFQETAGELAQGHLDTRVRLQSFPELEALAAAFNIMADEIQTSREALESHVARVTESNTRLEREMTDRQRAEADREVLHEQLVAASRDAGMAQLATGVLHNVGNVLNSVNVAAARATDMVRTSRVADLRQVATMVGEQTDLPAFVARDPRGRVLARFLDEIGAHLAREQAAVVRELGELRENIGHIREVISMQQSYARVTDLAVEISPQSLVDDALRMRENALARRGIEIIREQEADLPPIHIDKHRVLQILLNLISNAERAMESTPREARRLILRLEPTSIGIRISVIDHGDGIPPENLTRIFTNGFTTRTSGHGFGLHMAALAAQELGGSLNARSGGTGEGATFVLDVPNAASLNQETIA